MNAVVEAEAQALVGAVAVPAVVVVLRGVAEAVLQAIVVIAVRVEVLQGEVAVLGKAGKVGLVLGRLAQ